FQERPLPRLPGRLEAVTRLVDLPRFGRGEGRQRRGVAHGPGSLLQMVRSVRRPRPAPGPSGPTWVPRGYPRFGRNRATALAFPVMVHPGDDRRDALGGRSSAPPAYHFTTGPFLPRDPPVTRPRSATTRSVRRAAWPDRPGAPLRISLEESMIANGRGER